MSDAERAVALLRYANYAKVAAALDVSRATVAEWAKGRGVNPLRARQLEQLLRPDIQATDEDYPRWAGALLDTIGRLERRLAETKETPLPEWARGLEARLTDEVRENRRTIEETLTAQADDFGKRLVALAALLPQQPTDEEALDGEDRPATPRERSEERG